MGGAVVSLPETNGGLTAEQCKEVLGERFDQGKFNELKDDTNLVSKDRLQVLLRELGCETNHTMEECRGKAAKPTVSLRDPGESSSNVASGCL